MRRSLLEILRCPRTGAPLELRDRAAVEGDEIESGELSTADGTVYPIVRGIPRFGPIPAYTDSFGFQWNEFRRTQLDSFSGVSISRRRFLRSTGWGPEALAGARVLDVGCGAGRFAEIALELGATVVAVDAANAVDACQQNLGGHPAFNVVQADLYQLPFAPGRFDFVYCLGVLQHTPDVAGAFAALPPMLQPGGELVVDVYPKLWRNLVWPKYWLRPVTRHMAQTRLFQAVQRLVPRLLPVSQSLARVPVVGRYLRHLIPIADHSGVLALTRQQLESWAVLDTFDMFASRFDRPQSVATVREWFARAGMVDVSVERMGLVVGRGTRP